MRGLKHAAQEATGAYLVALQRFSNFVIHGTVPDDLDRFASSLNATPGCLESATLRYSDNLASLLYARIAVF